MSLSARDRKILMLLVPVAICVGYWMLLLSPKRQEETSIRNQLTQAQGARQAAAQNLAQLGAAKRSFATDYATVLELGKSIPAALDMPSLLVQLDAAARGTGITFSNVSAGTRSAAPGTPAKGAAAGASAPATPGPTTTASTSGVPGLDSIPLTFEFDGSFFQLADFFHQLKRFVQVTNNHIRVSGRLITVNGLTFQTQPQQFPVITANVTATVYLAPKAQGATAGASPTGPTTAGPATTPAAAPAGQSSATPSTPAATLTR